MKTRLASLIVAAALAAPVLAQAGPGPGADYDKYREQMWTRMQTMHEQMDKIRSTPDPQEREKLLREHYETMQQGMGTLRGFGRGPYAASEGMRFGPRRR